MDSTYEDSTENDPEHDGKPAEFRGSNGSDDRCGAGDRGKVMSEQNGPAGGDIVNSISLLMGRVI